ncbi:HAD-IIIA family hydrolase [Dyadobacter sp. NIV53]|uniref:D-glycero-alpha-D-manno-heptose-1,7-bisphosphate 7-phosphatase n=1 Tax=Dyadobacter sp. NIV53 TaxID=2861765 RepID=UPI001C87E7E4|nr:HAD family hydrolase [Dyadobacter sp. NIV53]
MRKAIFLDKDGTLVTDVPYNINPTLVQLEKGVLRGLSALQHDGYLLVIISNQPGIAMGLFSENDLKNLIIYLTNLFAEFGINIDGFYYCPHKPLNGKEVKSGCKCRKPEPGLILQAARDLEIDVKKSWMIGDILNDVEAGSRAGCRTILINNGNETEWEMNIDRTPTYLAYDFLDASYYIRNKTMVKNG